MNTLDRLLVVGGLAVVLGLGIFLWPYLPILAPLVALAAIVIGGVRLYMWWENHRIELEAKRNKARIPYSSEQGFVYIDGDGEVKGYSHLGFSATRTELLPPGQMGENVLTGSEPERPEYPQTFSQMADEGYIGPGRDFVLAFNEETGEPIKMPSLTSIGVGGGPGGGKTVTTLVLMLETIAKYNGKVKFFVVDPHMFVAGDEALMKKVQELTPYFLTIEDVRATVPPDDHDYNLLLRQVGDLTNPVVGGKELEAWMRIFNMEMSRRELGKTGDLWVIVMDEFAEIMSDENVAGSVARNLEWINQRARKMHMFSILVSQEWKATRTGGSELRHSVVSFIIHNMPQQIAELLTDEEHARQAPRLDVGEAVIHTRAVDVVGQVPYANSSDAQYILSLYEPRILPPRQIEPPTIPGQVHDVSEIDCQPVAEETIPPEFTISEFEEVRKLYLGGLYEGDIAKRVYHVRGGPDLAEARIKVRKMLEWMVKQSGRN
jgi:hypothetical protein